MATTYSVRRNRDGGWFDRRSGLDWKAAVSHAASLARVTERTIKRRLKDRSFSGGGICEVSGREIGDDGVWIEEDC